MLEALKGAAKGQRVLLILDDFWENQEKALNPLDPSDGRSSGGASTLPGHSAQNPCLWEARRSSNPPPISTPREPPRLTQIQHPPVPLYPASLQG